MFPDPFAMEIRAAYDRQQRHAAADHERRLALLPARQSPLSGFHERAAAMRGTGRLPTPWLLRNRVWRARGMAWVRPRFGARESE